MPLFEQDSSIALQNNPCACLSLTWEQRMYGFITCFVVGLVLSIFSVVNLASLNLIGFAVVYTMGNLISLLSSLFLIGPMKQLKMMMAPTRLIATLIYLGSMAVTLFSAFKLQSVLLTVIFMVIQFLALLWYCASYIPFARRFITNMCGSIV